MSSVKTMSVEKEVKSSAIVAMTSVTVITGQQNLSQLSHSHSVCFLLHGYHSDCGTWCVLSS